MADSAENSASACCRMLHGIRQCAVNSSLAAALQKKAGESWCLLKPLIDAVHVAELEEARAPAEASHRRQLKNNTSHVSVCSSISQWGELDLPEARTD